MRWTKEQLDEYLSKRDKARRQAQSSVVERTVLSKPMGEEKREDSNPPCASIVIVSHRRRLLDPDNLCAKYFIDGLRYCGLIRDDTAGDITYSISQRKVESEADERTEITIEYLPFNKLD